MKPNNRKIFYLQREKHTFGLHHFITVPKWAIKELSIEKQDKLILRIEHGRLIYIPIRSNIPRPEGTPSARGIVSLKDK